MMEEALIKTCRMNYSTVQLSNRSRPHIKMLYVVPLVNNFENGGVLTCRCSLFDLHQTFTYTIVFSLPEGQVDNNTLSAMLSLSL
jgi:hypothetical protein